MIETGPAKGRVFHNGNPDSVPWTWACGDCACWGSAKTWSTAHGFLDAHTRTHWQMFKPPAFYYPAEQETI